MNCEIGIEPAVMIEIGKACTLAAAKSTVVASFKNCILAVCVVNANEVLALLLSCHGTFQRKM